jgi:outer membrane cobalamin receptor
MRTDRDGWTAQWYRTHALSASVRTGGLQLDLSHRSSFSPPTLSDQFFSEGYAVRPNPDLRGERIPREVELGGRWTSSRIGAGASLFNGDVADLIVWQPDFRFVWSPSNADVRRSGGEAWIELRGRQFPWRAQGSFTHTRLRYDRAGDADTVQVAYRPRNTGNLAAAWSGPRWGLSLDGRYVGRRFPVPAPINALAGFWAWDGRIRHRASVGSWLVESHVAVHRIFDRRATLVFGFPDPGRTLSFGLSVAPGRRAATNVSRSQDAGHASFSHRPGLRP